MDAGRVPAGIRAPPTSAAIGGTRDSCTQRATGTGRVVHVGIKSGGNKEPLPARRDQRPLSCQNGRFRVETGHFFALPQNWTFNAEKRDNSESFRYKNPSAR